MSDRGQQAANVPERRRELQRNIGRLRRRLDRRAHRLIDQSLLVTRWRAYVCRYPGRSLLSAAAIGLLLSTRLPHKWNGRELLHRIWGLVASGSWADVWQELKQSVSQSSRCASTTSSEGQHD